MTKTSLVEQRQKDTITERKKDRRRKRQQYKKTIKGLGRLRLKNRAKNSDNSLGFVSTKPKFGLSDGESSKLLPQRQRLIKLLPKRQRFIMQLMPHLTPDSHESH